MAATTAGEQEVWESTIEGRVSVAVHDRLNRPKQLNTVGKGSRLRLTAEQRDLAEEVVRNSQNNPFRNGMLVQVAGPVAQVEEGEEPPSTEQALLDDDLGAIFLLTGDEFEATVQTLSEINVRRLKDMVGASDAAKSQIDYLDEYIHEKWPIGADTPSNAEARGDRTVTV